MLLSQEDQSLINGLFTIHKTQKETIAKILKPADKIKPGIEKIKVICEEKSNPDEEKSDPDNINCMEIIRHLIPLICLLTIHDEDTTFVEMFQSIDKNETIKKILIEQTKSWWGGHIEHDVITNIIDIYVKYMSNDKETNQIIRTVKELFIKNISNNNQLSQLIDKYIIPQELEKKTNAEVSTPYKLRQEMLDKIPADFWTKPHTVFEPCSGKGGFVIDIIDRFMTGLIDTYPDETQRYKLIVEQCLYFSDINPTNIFICHLLIDPYNEYKLNYNEGDTLKLDITTKWDIEGFDAVIGNPPYNSGLYKKFSIFLLNLTKILLFVIPSTFTIGVSHDKFILLLKNNGLKIIQYINRNIWIPVIDIDTLYLLCHKEYIGLININGYNIVRIENIHNIKNNEYIQIINKIKNHRKLELMKGKTKTLTYKNPKENIHIHFNHDEKYCFKILSRLNGGRAAQIYYSDTNCDPISGYKVLFPRGTATYNSINALKKISKHLLYSKITNETMLLSTGIVYINCISMQDAQFIQWYMMQSKFIRFMFITENKFSELTRGFVKLLPYIDYMALDSISDISIYKYFNFTDIEIKLIESSF